MAIIPKFVPLWNFREVKNSELDQSSKYIIELDNILLQLHEEDDYIAKDRKEIKRLGKQTRAMLTELRKQLG